MFKQGEEGGFEENDINIDISLDNNRYYCAFLSFSNLTRFSYELVVKKTDFQTLKQ